MIDSRSCVAILCISTGGCFASAPNLDDESTGSTTTDTMSSTSASSEDSMSGTATSDTSADTTLVTTVDATGESTTDTGDPSCIEPGPVTEFQCGNAIYEPGEICHVGEVLNVATVGTDIAAVPRDGAPADLVVANAGMQGPGLTYLLNDGTGVFLPSFPEGAMDGAFSVRVAQLDGGGAPDLVVGLPLGARVLLGQNGGSFIPGDDLANEGSATRVGFGELDNDNDLDVVRVSVDIPQWFTHTNDGGGTFVDGPGGDLTVLGKAFSGASDVVVGRFGEFDDDVVAVIVSAGFVGLIPLTGSGLPALLTDPDGMGGDAVSIAAGNLDADGVPDLVSAHGNRLRVYLADNDYGAPFDIPVDASGVGHVEVADIDRDGRGDLVTLAHSPSRVVVIREATSGDPKPFEIPLGEVSVATRLVVAPLNDDCVPDIAVAHMMGQVSILFSEP